MAIRLPDSAPIPAQRTVYVPAPRVLSSGNDGPARGAVDPARPAAPTTVDVVGGALALSLGAVRSAADVGRLAGQVAFDRLPIPGFLRSRMRRAWLATGSAGRRQREETGRQLGAVLDVVVPQVVGEVMRRIDLTRLVAECVDLDRIAAGLDVDAVAARLDVDRVVDRVDLDRAVARVDLGAVVERIDLDEVAARIDIGRILDRVDLDEVAARLDVDKVIARVDLDGAVDRVDIDRAAARIDLDAIIERADVVGIARYVIEAIDLPELIRSSTGSMTADVVRGVRAQGADADEAVQRVVDRLLRRRGARHDLAPGGER